jgi:hypothetical protein
MATIAIAIFADSKAKASAESDSLDDVMMPKIGRTCVRVSGF